METGTTKRPLLKSCRACGTEISWCSPSSQLRVSQASDLAIGLPILLLIILLRPLVAFAIYRASHTGNFAAPQNLRLH